ncbi:MAG: hypothetical protein ABIN67_00160 [Ferruginibacter sp.]
MKHLMILAFAALVVVSCNDKSATTTATTPADSVGTAAAPSETFDYAYTLDKPYRDWQPGDKKHAVAVMKSLKAFEDGDIATSVAAFGDTVDLRFDRFAARVSNDSLKKMFTADRAKIASMKVHMQDWESVISKDKKDEYVTLWYKEVSTDKKGKTDSIGVIDDLKIVNGKIVELDQKIQHYPAKKM